MNHSPAKNVRILGLLIFNLSGKTNLKHWSSTHSKEQLITLELVCCCGLTVFIQVLKEVFFCKFLLLFSSMTWLSPESIYNAAHLLNDSIYISSLVVPQLSMGRKIAGTKLQLPRVDRRPAHVDTHTKKMISI